MVDINELLARASKRASENIEAWIPQEAGDKNAGVIESITFVRFDFANRHRKDGMTPSTVIRPLDGDPFRYNWMGTLPEQTWERTLPQIGDVVAIEHHGEVQGKNDALKPYENIQIVVMDHATGEERIPDMNVAVTDYTTGEVVKPATGDERFELQEGEEKF